MFAKSREPLLGESSVVGDAFFSLACPDVSFIRKERNQTVKHKLVFSLWANLRGGSDFLKGKVNALWPSLVQLSQDVGHPCVANIPIRNLVHRNSPAIGRTDTWLSIFTGGGGVNATCLRCLKAHRALAEAAKAAVKGDVRRAGAEVKTMGAEIAGKIKDVVTKSQ